MQFASAFLFNTFYIIGDYLKRGTVLIIDTANIESLTVYF